MYHKKKGELVTKKDDRGRKTIFDSLGKKFAHFMPIGRLDFASEGLILLTNGADVATKLMTSQMERVYYIKIEGAVTSATIEAMENGLELQDATKGAHKDSKIKSMTFAPFVEYRIISSTPNYSKLKVSINEGKNRELRRFFAYFDTPIVDLKRIKYGFFSLGMLKEGKSRYLDNSEYAKLHDFLKKA